MHDATNEYDREKLQERFAKLAGKIGVISVGGKSEVEIGERKDRVDDAVAATKAAISEGVVAGGGATLAIIYKSGILQRLAKATKSEAQRAGVLVVLEAIKAPLLQIAANAGKSGEVVLHKTTKIKQWNAKHDRYEDLLSAGVIDPAKVTRVALENAASIAGMFLTIECTVTKRKEKE
jgi:chaperonin GroEL